MDNQDLLRKIQELEKQVDQLTESNFLYQQIIDKAPFGVHVFDREGLSYKINEEQKEILVALGTEEGVGKFNAMTDPYSIATGSNKPFTRVYNGEAYHNEVEFSSDIVGNKLESIKESKVLNETIVPIIKNDRVDYVVSYLQDITKQKLHELELLKTSKDLDILMENAPGFIIFKDTKNNIIRVSETVARMTGLPKVEIEGKPTREIYPDMADEYYKDDLRVIKSKQPRKGIVEPLPSVDGNIGWLLTDKIPYFDENKNVAGVIVFSTDITKIKQSEEELRRSETRFRALFEQTGGYCMILDPNTEDGIPIIIDANEAALKNHGYTREEFIGRPVADIDDEEGKKHVKERTAQIMSGKPFYVENVHVRKDGSSFHVAVNAKRIDIEGEPPLIFTTEYDISRQKKAEQELINAKEKAEEGDLLKTEFLHNLSHEIRTPMNGIIGFSDLINDNDQTAEERRYYTKIIHDSSHQLLKIIDDILEISKLETEQVKLNNEQFFLKDLLNETLKEFSFKSSEKGISIYLKEAPIVNNGFILTDKQKLNKIVSNLIDNAIKFTNEGTVEIGYNTIDQNLKIYVKDTGIGISPNSTKVIFQRFSQEDKDISRQYGGLGLGLSIAKENAQLLGGDILLSTTKGKGSTFTVTLPYKPANIVSGNNIPSFQSTSTDENTLNIIIAEDDEINYLYLKTIMQSQYGEKMVLHHAKDGHDAIKICKANLGIDLILMDIKMPGMNGLDATKQIKKTLPNLPIIAQTAYATKADEETALAFGCDAYISKPINKDQLFELINTYLPIE